MTTPESLVYWFSTYVVGAAADVLLNDISRLSPSTSAIIAALRPYFDNKSVFFAANLAGVTTLACVLVSSYVANAFLLNMAGDTAALLSIAPSALMGDSASVVAHAVSAFVVGYAADIAIEKSNIMPTLKQYYDAAGSGFWGAAAILLAQMLALAISAFVFS